MPQVKIVGKIEIMNKEMAKIRDRARWIIDILIISIIYVNL
jgi:hypothetical protein